MKVSRAVLIVGVLVNLLLGILIGYYIRGLQSGGEPIDVNPIAKTCEYSGKIYKSGEGFLADDGCNSCTCIDGKVGCTLMACE